MNKIKLFMIGLMFLLGLTACEQNKKSAEAPATDKCGTITIAEMNWSSASLMAHVDKIILEKGFGCTVELVAGDTMPTFTSMNEKGSPDVAPELWLNSITEPLNQAIQAGRLHKINPEPITDTAEGWFITPATRDRHPELRTVMDIIERPDLFPWSEDPSKGAFVGCPAGWGCQKANANLFRAFDMAAKGWVLVDPGSSAGLDGSMAKAVERDQNWFGWYWSPTAIVGRYHMVLVDYGIPYAGDANWNGCIALPPEECADPQPSAWIPAEVTTTVTDRLVQESPAQVTDYIRNRVYPGSVMNEMLVVMNQTETGGATAAMQFLRDYPTVWHSWVSDSVRDRIQAGL
jgi:glycine betaine/proline transport system substrate-binding protein